MNLYIYQSIYKKTVANIILKYIRITLFQENQFTGIRFTINREPI